jgi:hypothetical protein
MPAQRHDLVAALTSCIQDPYRARARRFLLGLSSDEMQFIAEFLGSCMIERAECGCRSRTQLAEWIARFCAARAARRRRRALDDDHKMILLVEYLGRTGMQPAPTSPAVN